MSNLSPLSPAIQRPPFIDAPFNYGFDKRSHKRFKLIEEQSFCE
jgi:hypothetical protein